MTTPAWRWTARALWFFLIAAAVLLFWIAAAALWAFDGLRSNRHIQLACAAALVASAVAVWHAHHIRAWCSPPQFSADFLSIEMKQPTLWDCLWLTRTE